MVKTQILWFFFWANIGWNYIKHINNHLKFDLIENTIKHNYKYINIWISRISRKLNFFCKFRFEKSSLTLNLSCFACSFKKANNNIKITMLKPKTVLWKNNKSFCLIKPKFCSSSFLCLPTISVYIMRLFLFKFRKKIKTHFILNGFHWRRQ